MKTLMPSCSKRRIAIALALSTSAFTAGWVSANLLYATNVNKGLVNAINSVGQNLFGSAVFSAIPPNPIIPLDPVRLFISDDSKLPVAFDVFHPPDPVIPVDPCRVYAQLQVASGEVKLLVDSSVAQDGIPIESADLSGLRPDVARCPAAIPPT